MKIDDVPQDHSSTYGGYRKLVYAVDEQGHYTEARSDGWDPEAFSTQLAVAELEDLEARALTDWQAGRTSPLPYLMYHSRLDTPALALAVGLWGWRVRRHFRPHVYRRLSLDMLGRYAEALGVPLSRLQEYQRGSDR